MLAIEKQAERGPALALIEGAINAALVLPVGNRSVALEMVPLFEGVAPSAEDLAEVHRKRAAACFEWAETRLRGIGDAKLMQHLADWRIWIGLMNPDPRERGRVQSEIAARMNDGPDAVGLVQFAWIFDIPFEDRGLRAQLARSESLGGLRNAELVAECLLNERGMPRREFIAYLEDRRPGLDRDMPQEWTTEMLFRALLRDGQVERARAVMSQRESHLSPGARELMEVALDEARGVDPRTRLEELYRVSGGRANLRNLIRYLKAVDDHTTLGARLMELFHMEPTLPNAQDLVDFWGAARRTTSTSCRFSTRISIS